MRALVPPALQMMAAEVPQEICQKLPPDRGKRRTSDSEDEDYVAEEDEATSRKVLKKEYGTPAATKPGLNRKVPAKRTPMLEVRGSTQEPVRSEPKEPEVAEK